MLNMPVEIITKEDLQYFRMQLLNDLKEFLTKEKQEHKINPWLRSREVKKILSISDGTLQNLRITGKIRSSKVGNLHYYRLEDIEALLSNNSQKR
jgi:hypothetical protein